MAMSADYRNFGPLGAQFDEMQAYDWKIGEQLWNRFQQQLGASILLPPFATMEQMLLTRSATLFKQVLALSKTISEDEVLALWDQFRNLFLPPLTEGAELLRELERSQPKLWFLEALHGSSSDALFVERLNALKRICYAPFRGDEVEWLLAKHPRIVELGGGQFYFANHFRRLGGDIVSIDNDSYQQLTQGEMHRWTLDFMHNGQMAIGGVEQLHRYAQGRALLMAAPEPGSPFPREAIELFAELGGQVLLLKLSGFVCDPPECVRKPVPLRQGHQNAFAFFQELCRNWREIRDPSAPPYLTRFFTNDMMAFERCA